MDHCFDHPHLDAVGHCKSCDRGLCRECAIEPSAGLLLCKEDLEDLNLAVGMARQSRLGMKLTFRAWGAFAVLGVTLLGLKALGVIDDGLFRWLMTGGISVIAIVFMFAGLRQHARFRRAHRRR